jgi:uncharacterized phage-like protein YoqJ
MILGSGNFLKTSEVQNGDIITFRDEGLWVENTKYKYPDGNNRVDFVIKIEINGEEKSMRLNKTNREIVQAAYGNDTSKWLGKTAKITKEKMLVAGKKQDCILLEIAGAVHEPEESPF